MLRWTIGDTSVVRVVEMLPMEPAKRLLPSATEELLLPSPDAAVELRTTAAWDQVTLIAKLTGRATTTAAETKLIQSLATQRLALG